MKRLCTLRPRIEWQWRLLVDKLKVSCWLCYCLIIYEGFAKTTGPVFVILAPSHPSFVSKQPWSRAQGYRPTTSSNKTCCSGGHPSKPSAKALENQQKLGLYATALRTARDEISQASSAAPLPQVNKKQETRSEVGPAEIVHRCMQRM